MARDNTSAKPVLEVDSLSKWYGSVCGIDQVSFAIEPGEIFGYLGPNGAGKTTTIRCIMGLLQPDAGNIHVFDRPVKQGKAAAHTRIGYLPGEFRIWKSLRARQSLELLASLGNSDGASARRQQLAERLGLDMNRRAWTLSKGNRQKIGIIYAFQHDPDLLVLDEPTSGLDPLVSQTVLELIREAADRGAAVLLSSHDLSEVAAVCRRAAILRKGRIVELARISDLIQQGQRQLSVWFAEGAPVPEIPDHALPNVHQLRRKDQMLRIAYQGKIDPVLKWLAGYSVSRIRTHETSLEEAFMQYYSNPDQKQEAQS